MPRANETTWVLLPGKKPLINTKDKVGETRLTLEEAIDERGQARRPAIWANGVIDLSNLSAEELKQLSADIGDIAWHLERELSRLPTETEGGQDA